MNPEAPPHPRAGRTLAIVSVALFMTALDNLVVGVALPSIREDLGGSLESLEWTVNAYTLSFAVFLITGAALGDRFGRRRMFTLGLTVFTAASALAALAPTIDGLVAARAVQGLGAAMVMPLTLTLLSEAFPAARRGVALGSGPASPAWASRSAVRRRRRGRGNRLELDLLAQRPDRPRAAAPRGAQADRVLRAARELDLPGLVLAAAGLFGSRSGSCAARRWAGRARPSSARSRPAWSSSGPSWPGRRGPPRRCCRCASSAPAASRRRTARRSRCSSASSARSSCCSQFFQTAQGYGPFEAGLRTLPWTGMPMLVAPIAGLLSDRIGSRPLMAAGLALQATAIYWLAQVSTVDVAYGSLVVPFVLGGTGMALVFAPSANAVLRSVRPQEAGQASGATNAIRELGGVMGVAVLASVFAANGSYASPVAYTEGLVAALPVGAAVLAAGAVAALLAPGRKAEQSAPAAEPVAAPRPAEAAPAAAAA
jgi:MFS family permease